MKNAANDVWRSRPGYRFQTRYALHQSTRSSSPLVHWLRIAVGLVTIAFGLALVVTPGPGLLFLMLGSSLLASESQSTAQRLDNWELAARAGARRLRDQVDLCRARFRLCHPKCFSP